MTPRRPLVDGDAVTLSAMRIAVIADDLTGAADAGVQLARAGHRTAVVFHGERADAANPGGATTAVVIDTDSRRLSPDEAAARVRACQVASAEIVMKKIDSMLRGPLVAEVEAALAASGRATAVVAPAFPATGRTTVDGVQLVDGEPVRSLRELFPAARVCDAQTDEDLNAIVRSVDDPSSVLWVGSAGLAAALGAVHPGAGIDAEDAGERGAVLVVVGSTNAVAREQLARVHPRVPMPLHGGDVSAEVVAALEREGVCALHPADGDGDQAAIAAALAETAAGAAEHFASLVLTGGDTAVHVARRLGATGLVVERELEPGVVVGRLIGPRPCRVVTKAGAFGSPGALATAIEELRA